MGGGNEKEGLDQNWCRSEIQFQRARGQVYYFVIFKITIIRSTLLHYTAHFVHRGEGVEERVAMLPIVPGKTYAPLSKLFTHACQQS